MNHDVKWKMNRLVCSGMVLLFLASCAISDGSRSGLRTLNEVDGIVAFNDPSFGTEADKRIIYSTTHAREEYVLYEQADHQAEFVYMTTRHIHMSNLVIVRQFGTASVAEDFRFNQKTPIEYGEAFNFRSNGISFWGKPYLLAERGKTCGVVVGDWDNPPDDLRPGKALFGYFCQPGRTPMTVDYIKDMIGKIGLRGITVNALDGAVPIPVLDPTASQDTLLADARGEDGARQGNPSFPYKVIRPFKRDDSCRYLPSC